jgi:hypothetical protein
VVDVVVEDVVLVGGAGVAVVVDVVVDDAEVTGETAVGGDAAPGAVVAVEAPPQAASSSPAAIATEARVPYMSSSEPFVLWSS